MTLDNLIRELKDLRREYGGSTEVRLAMQPRWSFEYSIDRVIGCEVFDCDDDDSEEPTISDTAIFLVEGEQLGYLATSVARQLGWE